MAWRAFPRAPWALGPWALGMPDDPELELRVVVSRDTILSVAKAPAGAKAPAAATVATAATQHSASDGNAGPDSKDGNLGPWAPVLCPLVLGLGPSSLGPRSVSLGRGPWSLARALDHCPLVPGPWPLVPGPGACPLVLGPRPCPLVPGPTGHRPAARTPTPFSYSLTQVAISAQ